MPFASGANGVGAENEHTGISVADTQTGTPQFRGIPSVRIYWLKIGVDKP